MNLDEQNAALAYFDSLAQMAATSLSMEHYFSIAVSKISPDEWERTFKRNPTWFNYYFAPPAELFQKAMSLPGVADAFQANPDAAPMAQWLEVFDRAQDLGHEAVRIGQELSAHVGAIEFDLGSVTPETGLETLAIFKVLMADTHELQRLGGWRTGSMVERYAHLAPDHLAVAASRLDSVLVATI